MKTLLLALILAAAVALTGSCGSAQPPAPSADVSPPPPVLGAKKLTVVFAVVDSLMPEEVTATTPNLLAENNRALDAATRGSARRAVRACLVGSDAACAGCPQALRPANADGIAHAWYTQDDPVDPADTMPASLVSKHPNLGDLVLGNHRHLETIRNTLIVGGGSPWVKAQVRTSTATDPLTRAALSPTVCGRFA